ncbi:MAG: hypothetical protein KKA35_04430, partial [Proteobacteria bacterium]|nr:hypothetical protein [Pseudomonadota bacterium]
KHKAVFGLFILFLISLISGCAFTPKPVLLIEKPSLSDSLPDNNLKLVLIVKDTRPNSVKFKRICGIMRNSIMIPTSFAFIANKDDLETQTAYHIRNILEKAGYKVINVSPPIPDKLSQEKLQLPPKAANGKDDISPKSYRDGNKADYDDAKDKNESISIDALSDTDKGAADWISHQLIEGADGVVEIKIDKYSSDVVQAFLFVTVQAWSRFKVALLEPNSSERIVLWGNSFTGYGTAGPRQVLTDECHGIAVNMSHWIAIHNIEKYIRSEEFLNSVRNIPKTK